MDTVYIGGGTPNILKINNIIKIISKIKTIFDCNIQELTVEINPNKNNIFDFELLKQAEVTRISIGVQSFNDNELTALGRNHTAEDIFNTINYAKKAGIHNISVDLMLGIPEQTKKSLKKSLDFCKNYNLPHISAYLLKFEKGTVFFKNQKNLSMNENDEVNLYTFLCDYLKKNNYIQYEISNFSLQNMESKHNLKYWNLDEYLGIGPSAHSFLSDQNFEKIKAIFKNFLNLNLQPCNFKDKNVMLNYNNIRFYYPNDLQAFLKNSSVIIEKSSNFLKEFIMLQFRKNEGLTNENFQKKFGTNIPEKYYACAKKFSNLNLVKINKNSIRLTTKGFLLSNSIISELLF